MSLKGVRKSYSTGGRSVVAVDGVDLTVASGQFATVLGPSGSGKTTLLRCIAGFETVDSGTITLGGRELDAPMTPAVRPFGRGISVVPQEGALFPHLDVARNVGFGLAHRSRAWRRERVAQLLELVGLQSLGDRRPHELSGGQQQRVALARALAPEPQLILLDEPFSALDAQLRAELREEVRELLRRLGTTTLLVTHDQAEAMALADHLVVMRAGRVVAAGDPRDVYGAPADTDLGRFLGEGVVLPGVRELSGDGLVVRCALGCLDVAGLGRGSQRNDEGACKVLVRPEQLSVQRSNLPDGLVVSAFGAAGDVVSQSFYGHDALVRVRLVDGEQVSVRVVGSERYHSGEAVTVHVRTPVPIFSDVSSS